MRNAGAIALTLVSILAGLLIGGSLVGQYQRTPGMEGEVRCVDGFPVTTQPHPDLVGEGRFENFIHEATHLNQVSAGCDSVALRWRDDPAFRLELEAEATCMGLAVYYDTAGQSVRRAERVRRISKAYLNSLGNTLGFEDIWAALDRWCLRP